MLSKKMMWICIVAFVLAASGVAFAAAVKIALNPYPAAEPVDPDASGKAVLNWAKGKDKTEIQVNCWGLDPEAEYTVYIAPVEAGPYTELGTFTTDESGEGSFHARVDGDVSGWVVAVNDDAGETVLLGP